MVPLLTHMLLWAAQSAPLSGEFPLDRGCIDEFLLQIVVYVPEQDKPPLRDVCVPQPLIPLVLLIHKGNSLKALKAWGNGMQREWHTLHKRNGVAGRRSRIWQPTNCNIIFLEERLSRLGKR